MNIQYNNVADYYNDHTENLEDYEYQRWFSRKSSVHSYNQTKKSLMNFFDDGLPVKNTIEIGCGAGTWTKEIVKHSNHVLALDISKNMINFAKKNSSDSIDFKVMDFLELDEKVYNNFDALVSMRMLRFLDDIDIFLKKVKSVLNDDGSCFIVDVNPLWIKRKLFGSNEDKLVNMTLRNPSSVKLKMLEHGFKDVHVKPVVIYMPPSFNPWLRFCDKVYNLNQGKDLSYKLLYIAESYSVSGHL